MIRASILISALALAAVAQIPEDKPAVRKEAPPGTLHAVAVKGNQRYSAAGIVKETGLTPGQRITAAIIEQARIKLQSTELFNNVSDQYRFTASSPPAYDLTFEVIENDQLFPMRFERLSLPEDTIRKYLREHVDLYSDKIPGTGGALKRYQQTLQDLLSKHDPSIKIKASVSNDDPQRLAILFAPDTPAPTISQVIVSGNEAVDTGTILRAVNQVAIGVPLSDTRLKLILDGAIKPLYAAKGYVAVSFPKIETEPSKSNLGVVVKVQISDGPVFNVGAIRFHGFGMEQDEIRAAIPFKPGQVYDLNKVENFRLDLLHRMKRKGLLDASVLLDTASDDAKRAVNITFNIIPGGVYNFQKLDIRGLDVTTAPVIERLWGEKPGGPFNPEYPDFFLKRVNEQGLFDNLSDTNSDYTADSATHNVVVHLYFKGGKSKEQEKKEKKEEEERRQSDGTWSPYPQLY